MFLEQPVLVLSRGASNAEAALAAVRVRPPLVFECARGCGVTSGSSMQAVTRPFPPQLGAGLDAYREHPSQSLHPRHLERGACRASWLLASKVDAKDSGCEGAEVSALRPAFGPMATRQWIEALTS